jgi:hypothetical protein
MFIFFNYIVIIIYMIDFGLTEFISYLTSCDSTIVNIFVYTSIINKRTNFVDKLDIKTSK